MSARLRISRPRTRFAVLGLVVLLFVGAIPTSYRLMLPGDAVDLSSRVTVAGHAAPRDRFLLTDVELVPANVAMLLGGLLPGAELVPDRMLVPQGISHGRYERLLVAEMDDSQQTAAIVAERAAGLPVALPPRRFEVAEVLATSAARDVLRPGDVLTSIGARPLRDVPDLARGLAHVVPGASVRLGVVRDGRRSEVAVRTASIDGKTRLGVVLVERRAPARLPVPVRFRFPDVSGSSGGLMFALDIYDSLHTGGRARSARVVAGTGTIALDGTVGAIAGTRQKLIAARRAGASVFFVPVANAPDVARETGLRIIPVRTFAGALAALRTLRLG